MTDMWTKWSDGDVRRAWQRHVAILYQEEQGDPHLDPRVPGARLSISPRAVRGTAEAHLIYQDMLHMNHRVAPVIAVDGGHRATQECVRYATLVEE